NGKRLQKTNNPMGKLETFRRPSVENFQRRLTQHERQEAMFKVATLLKVDGILFISLRHGPIPANRRMFQVSAKETVQLAEREGLTNTLNVEVQSTQLINRQVGVTWSWHAFSKSET
ncbi:hypothetical protein, partial [Methylomonas methanica]